MDILEHPSPNFDDRGRAIDMVVLHYTGMESATAARDRLCDPDARVSAHYLVDEDGIVTRLVAEEVRAWHAGVSFWRGATDINARSVGIEIVNPGHEFGYRAFPENQMAAVEGLLAGILARHDIAPARVVGHSDVAPSRKQDPGELFDWKRLAAKGLSVWPETPPQGALTESASAPSMLREIGYDPDASPADVITAFQRRFVPALVTGTLDGDTLAMIAAVHELAADA